MDLEFDSRPDATKPPIRGHVASVYLSHLKGYEGFGTAQVGYRDGTPCHASTCACSGRGCCLQHAHRRRRGVGTLVACP